MRFVKPHARLRFAAAAFTAVAAIHSYGTPADACSPPNPLAPGWTLIRTENAVVAIPTDGVLVLPAVTRDEPRTLEGIRIEIRDAAGELVEGKLELGQAPDGVIFRPSSPLAPSQRFHAVLETTRPGGGSPAAATGPVQKDVAELEFVTSSGTFESLTPPPGLSAVAEGADEATDTVCCALPLPHTRDTCGGVHTEECANMAFRGRVELKVSWQTHASAADEGMLRYRLEPLGAASTTALLSEPRSLRARFERPADVYCAVLVARSIIDGREVSSEPLCAPHGSLPSFEKRPVDRSDFLLRCASAPTGYEAQWSQARASAGPSGLGGPQCASTIPGGVSAPASVLVGFAAVLGAVVRRRQRR